MKLYKAKLYLLDKKVPYVKDKNLLSLYTFAIDNKKILYRDTYVDYKKDLDFREESYNRIFKPIYDTNSIIVKEHLNGTLEEIITGYRFPKIEIHNYGPHCYTIFSDDASIAYTISKPYNRIYAEIEERLTQLELDQILSQLDRKSVV